MKRFSILAILSMVLLILTVSLSFGQPKTEPKIQPKVPLTPAAPPDPGVRVSDNPRVQEFMVNPSINIQGGSVTFRWRVEPGIGGSPINRVRLSLGEREIHNSSSASGEYQFFLHPSIISDENRPYQFILTATNQINRSSTRTANLQILKIEDVFRGLDIHLEANPQEFRSRQPIEFKVSFTIPSIDKLITRMPFVMPVDSILLKQGSRIAGQTVGIPLPSGAFGPGYGPPLPQEGRYTIQDNGFTGSQEPYVVEISYRGYHHQKTFRIVPLLFRIH